MQLTHKIDGHLLRLPCCKTCKPVASLTLDLKLWQMTQRFQMASAPPDTVMQAVALGYKPGMPAPRVLAQGRGELAQTILDRAKALGIPTRTEPSLVAFLMELDLNAWVPPELFAAVAQVLAWAYEMDGKLNDADVAQLKSDVASQAENKAEQKVSA
jgi:flagellar biosynthesis protein